MPVDIATFADWLAAAHVPENRLTSAQRHVLEAAFHFRQRCGSDYYSTRLLSHWLLHGNTGLKVAQIARLLGLSRSAASAQQGLSSKEVIQAAHHRLAGRTHGKLWPRFAGPIAQFRLQCPRASRCDLLDFIQRTFNVRVSRQALHKFLKKYGLDRASPGAAVSNPGNAALGRPTAADAASTAAPTPALPTVLVGSAAVPLPTPRPPREFFSQPPSTLAPSSCCPPPSTGSPRPGGASRTNTARCVADC